MTRTARTPGQIDPARRTVTERLAPLQAVWYGEYPGTVKRLYADGATEAGRMYEVRLASGEICVCGSDLTPIAR